MSLLNQVLERPTANLPNVQATLNYLLPTTDKPVNYTYEPPAGIPRQSAVSVSHAVQIYNARKIAANLSIDRQGFALVNQHTAVKDFYDEAEIRNVYYPEAEEFLKKLTGASRIVIFDHVVRNADRSQPGKNDIKEPALRVHNDFTANSGYSRGRLVLEAIGEADPDALLRQRFSIINFWRAIANPIQKSPLALCDARSIAPSDLVETDLVYRDRLGELAQLFFKLGILGFGGPNAHITMMEDEVVKRRKWLNQERFIDLLGATNLIPGPNSTEMAIHIGYFYAGWLGLIVAGVSFILPAVLITTGFAWAYVAFGTIPQIAFLLYGIKPAVLGVIVDALWRLGKKAVKTSKLLTIAIAVALLVWFAQINEIIALLGGGFLGMIWLNLPDRGQKSDEQANLLIAGITTGIAIKATAATSGLIAARPVSLWGLGRSFLKIGGTLFGGGYVLLSLVQGEFVEGYGWLTQQQLLDAISIGQFTPGPILSTATFIGYIIAGIPGAIVATIAIFLPSFLFVAALNPLIPHLRRSKWAAAFLDAVNVSALALMAVVTVQLGVAIFWRSTVPHLDLLAVAIAIGSAILGIRFSVNSAWLVLGGAAIGWLAFSLRYFGNLPTG